MRRRILPYDSNLKKLARTLRNHSTLSEVLLWRKLRRRQLRGYDFHRQRPIGAYIIDFFCQELSLAVEIDGSSHDDKIEYDRQRQTELEESGITFLRFHDRDVKRDLPAVLRAVECWIEENERRSGFPS